MTSTRSLIAALTATALVGCATAGGNKEDAAAVEKAIKKDTAPATQNVAPAPAKAPAKSTAVKAATTANSDRTQTAGNDPKPSPSQANPGVVTGSGFVATEDTPLSLDITQLTDPDGLGRPRLQWQIYDGTGKWRDMKGETNTVFTPRQSHVGTQLRVQISYTDGKGVLETIFSPVTEPVVNVNDSPSGMINVLGLAQEKKDLAMDLSGLFDEDGLGTPTFVWQSSTDGVDWTEIEAVGNSLTLTQSEVSKLIRGIASYTDGFGELETVSSAAVGPVANVNDPVEGQPQLLGDAVEGASLAVATSELSDADGIYQTYVQWEASINGSWQLIPGATDINLELDSTYAGSNIRALVTVVDNFGIEETLATKSAGPVQAINSRPRGTIMFRTVSN